MCGKSSEFKQCPMVPISGKAWYFFVSLGHFRFRTCAFGLEYAQTVTDWDIHVWSLQYGWPSTSYPAHFDSFHNYTAPFESTSLRIHPLFLSFITLKRYQHQEFVLEAKMTCLVIACLSQLGFAEGIGPAFWSYSGLQKSCKSWMLKKQPCRSRPLQARRNWFDWPLMGIDLMADQAGYWRIHLLFLAEGIRSVILPWNCPNRQVYGL